MSQDEEKNLSPANAPEKRLTSATRVPMSLPQQKLAIPEIPGYHLHWMNSDPARINQALRAGYEFVEDEEVNVVNFGLADDASKSGNSDMGSRVSVISGTNAQDEVNHLILMKIRQEWWEEDQAKLAERNESIAASLRGGTAGDGAGGSPEQRYIPEASRRGMENLFTPKRR